MSTTHVQSLPNVRGRMSYTEFGEGKRRRAHLENGTDRIAAQMGDDASREDFIVYCEGQRHRHPNAVNEGYELRISWATDELDPSRADDIQRGMERDAPAPEVTPDVPEMAEPAVQPSADFALDVYDLDRAYVSEMASDLQRAHIHRSREEGKPFMDERYRQIVEADNHPDEQLAKLREDVDATRREFHASKEALDTLQSPCPGLLADMQRRVKKAEQRAPVRTPRSADKDTQFDE